MVSREGSTSGQLPIDFGAAPAVRILRFIPRRSPAALRGESPLDADGWCALAADLEPADPAQALDGYRKALELDPDHAEARVNLGRLLHEAGHVRAAEMQYRLALKTDPDNPTALFNLGVALEDRGSPREALKAYEQALAIDPDNADAHYNLSRLHEKAGRKAAAIRHLKAYRQLTQKRSG